jgi:hypothetical protein
MRRRVGSRGPVPPSTLEGNQAHGRRGRPKSATAAVATDPTAEQGLEVEGRRAAPATVVARRSNDEEAMATATWNGCWRGDFFEGCERADGEAPSAPDQGPSGRLERCTGARNAANPFRYRDATSPGARARRKPSRWCETTRAERVGWWQPVGRWWRQRHREWTRARDIGGRAHHEVNPTRGKVSRRRQRLPGASHRNRSL